jgi:hypothetical protein
MSPRFFECTTKVVPSLSLSLSLFLSLFLPVWPSLAAKVAAASTRDVFIGGRGIATRLAKNIL